MVAATVLCRRRSLLLWFGPSRGVQRLFDVLARALGGALVHRARVSWRAGIGVPLATEIGPGGAILPIWMWFTAVASSRLQMLCCGFMLLSSQPTCSSAFTVCVEVFVSWFSTLYLPPLASLI